MAEILEEQKRPKQTVLKILLWLAMFIFASQASTHMVAAGDTWVALACGKHYVNHGVNTVEPFSYNSHKAGPSEEQLAKYPKWSHNLIRKWHPTGWINQNWLTHVIFYKLVTAFGSPDNPNYNMLVAWKFIINFLVMVCLYFTARLIGASSFTSALMCCVSLYVARSFLDIRPAVFSNLLVPVWIMILIATLHKNYRYIWLSVPLAIFWSNVHGGYLYMFVVLVPFFGISLLAYYFKIESIPHLNKKALIHTFCAGMVAFVAMIVFNPYHLTNLTHTFIISASKHAEDWRKVSEWHSAFELSNPVGESMPFIMLFFAFWLIFFAWFFSWISNPIKANLKKPQKNRISLEQGAIWPSIDLSLIAIVIFTLFMAVKSRRFIPIAVFVAAPFLALWLDQIYRMLSIRYNARKVAKFRISEMPAPLIRAATFTVGAVVVVFGVVFGLHFKRIYLDPFPASTNDSIFMRMTASYLKPFDACAFIRENNLSGHMINYWTEGGFIAFAENPDKKTGEIPLKLFMDGRAQAAYDIELFNTYNHDILMGGKVGEMALYNAGQLKRSQFTKQDRLALVDWYKPVLAKYNAWLVLMPKNMWKRPLMQALETMPNWRLVFTNDRQKIVVDTSTAKGKALFEGIFTGKTKYPHTYNWLEIETFYMLMTSQNPEHILQNIDKIYHDNPSLSSLRMVTGLRGENVERLKVSFFKKILQEFSDSADKLRSKSGYTVHLYSAMLSCDYLIRHDGVNRKKYKAIMKDLDSQRDELLENCLW